MEKQHIPARAPDRLRQISIVLITRQAVQQQRVDGIFVAVSDDGQGMPVGVLNRTSQTEGLGIGITGMRERVKLLGGHLEIETNCNGTRVEATIPSRHFRSVTADAVAHVAY